MNELQQMIDQYGPTALEHLLFNIRLDAYISICFALLVWALLLLFWRKFKLSGDPSIVWTVRITAILIAIILLIPFCLGVAMLLDPLGYAIREAIQ